MNWKIIYPALLVSATLLFLFSSYNSDYSSTIGLITILLRGVIYSFVFLFAIELNRTLVTKSKRSVLKVYEILSYITFVLLILSIFGSAFLYTQGSYRYAFYDDAIIFALLFSLVCQLTVVICLFLAYRIRRLQTYNLTGKGSSEFDVLDDFGFEDENELKINRNNPDMPVQFFTVEERVKVCQVCTKKGFNKKIGIVCSLTDAKPEFIEFCNLHEEDPTAKILHGRTALTPIEEEAAASSGSWKGALVMSVLGFLRAALKGFDDVFGLVFLGLGIVWLMIAIASSGRK